MGDLKNCCAELGLNPFLIAVQDKVPILEVFAQQVRSEELAAHGNPILAPLVEAYIRDVVQTFLGVEASAPGLNTDCQRIDFSLTRLQATWKKQEPPPLIESSHSQFKSCAKLPLWHSTCSLT